MGITTKDLAAMCGVSRTTVHRALSGVGRIHPDTKEMILRIAREHDYRPDLLARGLVKGRTYNIGIVVLDVRNRYFAEMLSVIGAEMNRRGYCMNIMLHDNDSELEKEQMTRLAAYHMDGIILSSVNEGEEYRAFLESLNVPIVTVDNKIVDDMPFVSIDQSKAMQEAADCLCERGYRKIVYVCPIFDRQGMSAAGQNLYVHKERMRGFETSIKNHPDTEAVYLTDQTYLAQAKSMIDPKKRTAFLCAADSFALDIMKELRKENLQPPQDYGIIGFDNIDTLDYVSPRLTTVHNSVQEVAVAATELLFELIGEEADTETVSGSANLSDASGNETEHKAAECRENRCHRILPHQIILGETI